MKQFFNEGDGAKLQTTDAVGSAELEFLRQFQDELVKTDIPFLESVPSDAYLADRISAMKNRVTVPLKGSTPVSTILGPSVVCLETLE